MSRNPPPGLALVERTAEAARGRLAHPSILTVMSGFDETAYRANVTRVRLLIASSANDLCPHPASPELLGERRGEQGVARGVPPPGTLPADLDGRLQNHVLHHFRAATPARSVISERRIGATRSAARYAPRCPARRHRFGNRRHGEE